MKFSGTPNTAYNCFHIGGENTELLIKSDAQLCAIGHCIVNVDNQFGVFHVRLGDYLYFCQRIEKMAGNGNTCETYI